VKFTNALDIVKNVTKKVNKKVAATQGAYTGFVKPKAEKPKKPLVYK
jgi:hypothetical protein